MWDELWQRHRGGMIGIGGGLLGGLIYLIFGFWDMLVVALIIYCGYHIGSRLGKQQKVIDLSEWYRRMMQLWRRY